MPLAAATRLGPYEILAPIGAGGMGEVYRARDERLGRDVAIKVLPPQLALDRVALARFERETRAVAALSHPNILAIFDIGQEAGVAYAVTELLEGETLRERLRAGSLTVRKALEYGAQVAQGLAAAHDKGLVHRDLKPENIFLAPDGRAKILDFGLAKQASGDASDPYDATIIQATDPGTVAGTPSYMAPEQVRGQAVSPQTDLFSLGCVLYEMLAGRRAFQGQTPAETMTAVLREEPPDLCEIDPRIPPPVAHLVRHCLEKQAGERFQSARDVAFNLQVLAGTPTPTGGRQVAPEAAADASSPSASQSAVGILAPGRSRLLRVGAAVLALAVIGAAAWAGWFTGHRGAAQPHFTRVSYTPKVVFRAAFTPDKDGIVYSAATDANRPELFTLGREYPTARRVGLPPGTQLLAVSRTGELALLTRAEVVSVDVLRGTLARMPLGATAPREVLGDVREADWTPDGAQLAIIRTVEGMDRLELPAGRVLYKTPGYLSDVRVSPDGSRLAVLEHAMKWEGRSSLVVIDLKGGRTVLTPEYPYAHGVAWLPGGAEILVSASPAGAGDTAVYAVDLKGRQRLALQAAGHLTIHDASGAGRWLVSRDDRRAGLRVLVKGEAAERDLSWLDQSRLAAISDDGASVLFSELAPPAGASGSVCFRKTDDSPVVTLGDGAAQDLSPDGRWALAMIYDPSRLVLYPTGPGERRDLARGSIEEFRWASWFPDGRQLLVCGAEKGRASRCYVQAIDGGAPRPVTADGEWGIVSPDGQRVLAWRPDARSAIYRLGAAGAIAAPEAVPSSSEADVPVRWTADGRGVLVYRPGQVPAQIDRIDLATGRREMVRTIAPPDRTGLVSLDPVLMTPDHASYAYTYMRVLSTLFTVEGVK